MPSEEKWTLLWKQKNFPSWFCSSFSLSWAHDMIALILFLDSLAANTSDADVHTTAQKRKRREKAQHTRHVGQRVSENIWYYVWGKVCQQSYSVPYFALEVSLWRIQNRGVEAIILHDKACGTTTMTNQEKRWETFFSFFCCFNLRRSQIGVCVSSKNNQS